MIYRDEFLNSCLNFIYCYIVYLFASAFQYLSGRSRGDYCRSEPYCLKNQRKLSLIPGRICAQLSQPRRRAPSADGMNGLITFLRVRD